MAPTGHYRDTRPAAAAGGAATLPARAAPVQPAAPAAEPQPHGAHPPAGHLAHPLQLRLRGGRRRVRDAARCRRRLSSLLPSQHSRLAGPGLRAARPLMTLQALLQTLEAL